MCNIPFRVVDTPVWKAIVVSIAQLGEKYFSRPSHDGLKTSHSYEELHYVIDRLEPLKSCSQKFSCSSLLWMV